MTPALFIATRSVATDCAAFAYSKTSVALSISAVRSSFASVGVYNALFADGCLGLHADRARNEQPASARSRFASVRAQAFAFYALQRRTNEASVRLETWTQLEIPGLATSQAAPILVAPFCRVSEERACRPWLLAASFHSRVDGIGRAILADRVRARLDRHRQPVVADHEEAVRFLARAVEPDLAAVAAVVEVLGLILNEEPSRS